MTGIPILPAARHFPDTVGPTNGFCNGCVHLRRRSSFLWPAHCVLLQKMLWDGRSMSDPGLEVIEQNGKVIVKTPEKCPAKGKAS